jgi:hypothetical protein
MKAKTECSTKVGGFDGINISNHAAMRYAERIADRDSLVDINIYVQQNLEKIEEDINTMLKHSELIYRGKTGKDKGITDVYLSGTWVILVDTAKNKVITLYKVDFGVGEDFNKQYIQRVLERMNKHKQELEDKKEQIATQRNDYLTIIKENEIQIAEYRTAIKNLEKINIDYKEIVEDMDAECSHLEFAVRHDVEDLMGSLERRSL